MQIQMKVALLVALTVAGAVGAVIWKTSGLIREEKSGIIAESSEKQLAPVRRLIQAQLDVAKGELVQFALRHQSGIKAGSDSGFGHFDVVALVFDGPEHNGAPTWVEKRAGSTAAGWPQGYEITLIKSLPFSKLKSDEVRWVRRAEAGKEEKPVYAVMVPVEIQSLGAVRADSGLPDAATKTTPPEAKRGVVIGLSSENPVSGVTDDFAGGVAKIFVVDDQGYVASHSNKSFVGDLFSEDALVKEIMKKRVASGTLTYEDLELIKVDGSWERAEHSNLYAVVATPVRVASGMARDMIISMTYVGLGGVAIATIIAFLAGSMMSASLKTIQRFVLEWKSGNFQPGILGTQGGDEFGDLAILLAQLASQNQAQTGTTLATPAPAQTMDLPAAPAEASGTFSAIVANPRPTPLASADVLTPETLRKMAQGLSTHLKEPVNSILGHSQLLKGKISGKAGAKSADPETEMHVVSIERDVRLIKNVVDQLVRVAGDDIFNLKPSTISEIIDAALVSLEREFSISGAKIVKNVDNVPLVSASRTHLQAAIREIILQSAFAVRNRPQKEISLRVQKQGERVLISISDKGVGMSRDQASRYFEPFFQPFEGAANPGLGMAMAQAVIERHIGDVSVDSATGVGTTVNIELQISANQEVVKTNLGEVKTSDVTGVSFELKPPPPLTSIAPLTPALKSATAKKATAKATAETPPPPPAEEPAVEAAFPSFTPDGSTLGGLTAIDEQQIPDFPPMPGLDSLPPMDLSRTAPPSANDVSEIAFPGSTNSLGMESSGDALPSFFQDDAPALAEPAPPAISMLGVAPPELPEMPAEMPDLSVEAPAEAPMRIGSVTNVDVPASFLDDDDKDTFSAVGLTEISTEAMRELTTTPRHKIADEAVHDFGSPADEGATIVLGQVTPLEVKQEKVEEPAEPEHSQSQFKVKIRRPRTKG